MLVARKLTPPETLKFKGRATIAHAGGRSTVFRFDRIRFYLDVVRVLQFRVIGQDLDNITARFRRKVAFRAFFRSACFVRLEASVVRGHLGWQQ